MGPAAPALPFRYEYRYNLANQRIRMILADGTYWKYDYDDLGQLILGTKYWPDGTEIAGQNFTYSFDDIGNRTQTGGRASAVSTYQTNELNQYTRRTVSGSIDVFGRAEKGVSV